ncbi:undecaprenyl-diphosphatase [Planotetraspora silvatica]|uniref:Undecaprenyl-diphosphatase n=1 Tax=Planotetraspora silvatica TaxID=234614 RepID=A0A8J3UMS6_9ACTN|nr:undecaprenyl-diphosphate phosphatase [Planotetraspora silvatica]GII47276.1 undecaprenyl-diphosphatase [Planotetraspora silvatica]
MSGHLSYVEALVVGALQGVTELFPVSSLGHSVLLPALVGGRWADDLSVSTQESPYLAFIVGLHVATALALMVFFWRDWLRIVTGFVTSVRHRRVATADERLAWMIIIATIPVGITGLLLEHTFRTVLGRPLPAALFLALNGVILYGAELLRRRALDTRHATTPPMIGGTPDDTATTGDRGTTDLASDRRITTRSWRDTTLIGTAQVLALLPGISRSGATMAAGLFRGLDHDDAARFSFLLATPVILAAGVLKLPDLFGPLGDGIHGQVLAGSAASFVCAYLAVRFLTRYFQTRTLIPFAVYCTAAGVASFAWLATR